MKLYTTFLIHLPLGFRNNIDNIKNHNMMIITHLYLELTNEDKEVA